MSAIQFSELVEGATYNLDWYINGVQRNYVARVIKKNTSTVYVELLSLLPTMALTVCYQHLVDTTSNGDHTWFKLHTEPI